MAGLSAVIAFVLSVSAIVQMRTAIEAEALKNRVDLEIAKLELEALARSYGLTEATRYVTDLVLTNVHLNLAVAIAQVREARLAGDARI